MSDFEFPMDDARRVVHAALVEDLGGDDGVDVTTEATIPRDAVTTGEIVARAPGVVAGLPVAQLVVDETATISGSGMCEVNILVPEGTVVARGDVLATVSGPTATILTAERTILNILSRISGVATATRDWADALEGTGATVLDTRKTTPGMRALQKYAVRAGGGTNKRLGLFDVAMIKDNHKLAAGSITAAYDRIRERFPDVPVQVEVTTVEEGLEAVAAGARFIMCDNMSPELLAETIEALSATGETIEVEATGGLTLERAAEYAATGVDYLSVGALTHSAAILDIALDLAEGQDV
ncbi:nicotinate-nucleotide pyrophosphorylase (carboxylating) (quinolinate phosphoribosyltransferase (decarboxylating); QAPRTase) [Nostocoides australiense Ben110]|uniref:Nicotinate-nucleotide pyrophosphorylase [carboxylating] n=1 Tax=Nostocoides australiense Ben110 TaxID=1193182 RepID=W6JSH9_9MICO|nr:carboxylating nicotinate-nucleotide diphosphorylase [Tetrasphaera australiensis]MCA0290673.1 carboxylating nicotinate-nucleotide diphosphorylase [Actinomycetota bacterium]CCH71903.1 nicotinate-nucleotide pyrophosphorylase (carboxylating) (quinolinate phosphoribosyltransferase (decarboxylating); QAPRTase) [Tetrasphaera australiensis Ben110]